MAFRFRSESRAAVNEYKSAKDAQHRLQESQKRRGVKDETPAYVKANKRTLAAEERVSWFRR
jgi:hypothetical protein